jgi:hypothetical protein
VRCAEEEAWAVPAECEEGTSWFVRETRRRREDIVALFYLIPMRLEAFGMTGYL